MFQITEGFKYYVNKGLNFLRFSPSSAEIVFMYSKWIDIENVNLQFQVYSYPNNKAIVKVANENGQIIWSSTAKRDYRNTDTFWNEFNTDDDDQIIEIIEKFDTHLLELYQKIQSDGFTIFFKSKEVEMSIIDLEVEAALCEMGANANKSYKLQPIRN